MYRHTKLTTEQEQYISDIIAAQNKLRAQLPYLYSYKPDIHFDYLSAGNKNKHKIDRNKLVQLLPLFKQQEFRPLDYLDLAVKDLNMGGGQADGLTYRGYLKLVNTQRSSFSGGSEVNKTLLNRLTVQHAIYNQFPTINGVCNTKADSIIGMLLYLECLKAAEESGGQYLTNKDERDMTVLVQKDRKLMNTDNDETVYNIKGYGRGLKFDQNNNRSINSQFPSFINLNPQQTVRKRPRKPIFSLQKRLQTQISQQQISPSLQRSYYMVPDNKNFTSDNRTVYTDRKEFLEHFSSDNNVWKNISERNYHNKLRESGSRSGDSAFYYETPRVQPAFYAKSPSTQPSYKLKNYTHQGYYIH